MKTLQIGVGDQQKIIDLKGKNCHLVAFGKAVIGMVTAVESVLGNNIVSGIASISKNVQEDLAANGKRCC